MTDPLQCTFEDARRQQLLEGMAMSTEAKVAWFEEMVALAVKFGAIDRLLSFKHAVQVWLVWRIRDEDSCEHEADLLIMLAQRRVGRRPGRVEPRTVKRRPKPYRLLMRPRAQAHELVRAHGHG